MMMDMNQFRRRGGEVFNTSVKKNRKRRGSKLPKYAVDILTSWFEHNADDPYPSFDVKNRLLSITGLKRKQLVDWFTNERRKRNPNDHTAANYQCAKRRKIHPIVLRQQQ